MADEAKVVMNKQAAAHRTAESEDIARLRGLNMSERGRLIESACESAAAIDRSRLAAGMAEIERDPWPESTLEFFRKQAARVRS
ncbi:MAG: hypothetical protein ABSG67_14270 [Thermoguttaceae bacterium]|jgi:hypothetical protein